MTHNPRPQWVMGDPPGTGVVGHFHCYIVLKDNTPNVRSYTIGKA